MENKEMPGESGGESAPPTDSAQRHRKRFSWNWVIAPALLIVGIAIGYLGRPLMPSPQAASSNNTAPILQLLISKTRHWQGSANAPVTILEFSDFQ